jgi:hypothetical protein
MEFKWNQNMDSNRKANNQPGMEIGLSMVNVLIFENKFDNLLSIDPSSSSYLNFSHYFSITFLQNKIV